MRELILSMSMSLDGFVSGPGGNIGWMFGGDQEAIAWKVATVANASLHIMGSRTFRDMAGFWPTATGPFAPPMNRIPKAVFSTRGTAVLTVAGPAPGVESAPAGAGPTPSRELQPGAESWGTAYVAGGDLGEEIATLKAGDGAPIVAHGGVGFVRSLIARGLVDRYALLVHPVALGGGASIFGDLAAPRRFGLDSSRVFPGGAVGQVYRPG